MSRNSGQNGMHRSSHLPHVLVTDASNHSLLESLELKNTTGRGTFQHLCSAPRYALNRNAAGGRDNGIELQQGEYEMRTINSNELACIRF
ncbi:hypothetical protein NPIL_287661 [Nephila pilipes]|uniref:Uncharacterized protein n=1 Tax=Nephila pilipes TaxID=299642 RepID=A0A8X6NP12_NEPPI|nr:hypothetical protein NPIL_287661 [Nephila pilipes]